MGQKNLKRAGCTVLVLFMMLTSLVSCRVQKELPTENEEAPSEEISEESSEEQKPAVLKLRSGRRIRLDREGRVTKKAVYSLKSGTGITKKEIKKTGGVSRWFRIYRIRKGSGVYKRINGKSYKKNSAVSLDDLRYVRTLYHDFKGKIRTGEIIVNKAIAGDTEKVFRELYDEGYQIRKMRLVDDYWKKGYSGTDMDNASMNDDNTSGFNYRMVAGTSSVSMHGYGRAIDVNPFENPWCPGGKLYPNQSASREYADRGRRLPHMIFSDSEITKIFKKHGFRWLGDTGTRDYQHFEK